MSELNELITRAKELTRQIAETKGKQHALTEGAEWYRLDRKIENLKTDLRIVKLKIANLVISQGKGA